MGRFEELLHKYPFSPILKTNLISVKKPILVLTCIMTTSFEGKKLDNKCTHSHHHLLIWALSTLGFYFCLEAPFPSVSFLWSLMSSSALISLYSPPKGLNWSLHFFPGTLPHHHHPLHTPVTKVCPVISQKTSKMVHAPRMCSRRHVHKILHPWP